VQNLIAGIHRFQTTVFSSQRDLFQRLARGQSPDALFVTCSDSRISPNLITQTAPGELFILRNAGNIVPRHERAPTGGEAATIEFAIAALGVRDIIVCGHSHCGAIRAVLEPVTVDGLPSLRGWLEHAAETRRIVLESYGNLSSEHRELAAVGENVLVQLENLQTHPVVAQRLADERLALHGWVYKIETGEVFAFDRENGQFVPLVPGRAAELAPEPPLYDGRASISI
jgi:carbonic anhydrase